MKREDIVRMAREAGFEADEPANDVWITDGYWADYLERFAALVAASERECIIAKNAPEIEKINAHIRALEEAVAAEREACLALCKQHAEEYTTYYQHAAAGACEALAQAIEKRGKV